jgi:hypothetical protein
MRARLLVAVASSGVVILAAPFVGELRGVVQSAFPGQYRTIVGGTVLVAMLLAITLAVRRIRDRKLFRHGVLVTAVAAGVVYARLTSSGNPDVDVVERFHFVEYGLLTFLFYRAWHGRDVVTALVLPVLAGILVGAIDEWFQWFIPGRVGEMRDVLLNSVAIGCGLLFSIGVDPPVRESGEGRERSRRTLAAGAALVIVFCALFFHVVHLGYEVRDPDAGAFRSRFSAAALHLNATDRAARWREQPPVRLRRLSREDQYLSEGLWHVRRRNDAASEADGMVAWRENLILERFFAPVLEFPSYAAPSGTRWPAEQRADVAARTAGDTRSYVSDAHVYPIYLWNRATFWSATAAAVVLAVLGCLRLGLTARSSSRPRA